MLTAELQWSPDANQPEVAQNPQVKDTVPKKAALSSDTSHKFSGPLAVHASD